MTDTILDITPASDSKYLETELGRIDAMLKEQVRQAHSRDHYWQSDKPRGLYISETESADLANTNHLEKLFHCSSAGYHNSQSASTEQLEKNRVTPDEITRLDTLVKLFGLTSFEKDVLLLCLLPELDPSYERIFGYILDDVTRRKPSVALALDMLCPSPAQKVAKRQAFSANSPSIRYHLFHLHDDTPRKQATLLAQSLKINDRICEYLLGSNEIDASLHSFAHIVVPQKAMEEMVLPDEKKVGLTRLMDLYQEGKQDLTWYFYGAEGTGKQSTAEALCKRPGLRFLVADTRRMLHSELSFETAVRLLCREALLQDAAMYWDNFDVLLTDSFAAQLDVAIAQTENHRGIIFFAGNEARNISHKWNIRPLIPVEFPVPEYHHREQLWQAFLNGQATASQPPINALAGKFRLSGGQIQAALATARNLAQWRNGGSISADELYHACRQQSNQKLTQLARKIKPKYIWGDIVLPKDQLEQLKELCSYVKYHHLVYNTWGFSLKSALGKGLNALFTGSSGTGKTMAAEITANELGIDLYKIDLATVVSKYVGETEKNLDKIFQEAQDSNAILFFDEADAIFGKRSEVRDSHDRYANIEIAYLLQKMEEYQGIVILATNFRKNLDEAFARRMHFSLEFPLPEEEDRLLIWQKAFPAPAPLAQDIDLAFMARQFRITGGNIKNVALSAAFLAAENGHAITMKHLILATRREFQKMGKLCTESDFAHYFEMVKA